jgi:uncharacterized iron-regulated membrane protein
VVQHSARDERTDSVTNPRILNRKVHRWGAIVVALPFLVVLATGILLQLKKQLPWVQPAETPGTTTVPTLSPAQMLAAVQRVPEANAQSWADIDRVDLRPAKGMVKVITTSRWEVQLDAATGEVLHSAYRRSDLLESLHDGSWFHPAAKLWVFLPAGVVVFVLWGTGLYLFLVPILARRRSIARNHPRA